MEPVYSNSTPSADSSRPITQHRRRRRGKTASRFPPSERRTHGQDAHGREAESNTQSLATFSDSLALRPASIAPSLNPASAEPSSAEASAAENHNSSSSRGRGGRGRARGSGIASERGRARGNNGVQLQGSERGNTSLNNGVGGSNGRQFVGRLTQEGETVPPVESTLQADAPEFRPGQQYQSAQRNGIRGGKQAPRDHHQHRHSQNQMQHGRRPSMIKSNAPDIATRTHEDIHNAVYECPICTNEVARNSKIWSCKTCWTVFHLTCIKKWSTNEGSAQAQQPNNDGGLPPARQWRCPGCNLPKDELPSTYTCWCAKETEPRSISGIPPHSCGQSCGKSRLLPKQCPHPCELLCHAGPCPPCKHMGPVQSCFCGKSSTSRRCAETNYETGWSCGEICGDLMPCGEHTCQKPCHEGLCGACELQMDCRCYCGKVEQAIICCERGDSKPSSTTDESWIGKFNCGSFCLREFDCGKHRCEKKCHPNDAEKPHCPRSPDVVSHCPCGKTLLHDISTEKRKTCMDSIPNCEKRCLKKLLCGHTCQEVCHSGECMPCLATAEIACRCGRTHTRTTCHQGTEQRPQCMKTCKATLNCGRHECGERCCSGEKKAVERQAIKRKLRPLGVARTFDEGFEAEHICTRSCGRRLKCGNHICSELCHKGPCGSCREAIFEEVSCSCGKTVLHPPLPCGTASPPCRFECERPKECGHPLVPHNCHDDEESCPKCPFLAQKPCLCGKKTLKNQPCWLTEVRCGEVCGRGLRCGSHFCRKQCHRPGECEDAGKACQQACGKAKKSCGHPCEMQCHAPSSCREDKPCPNKTFITCECQHLKQEVKCNASKVSEGNSKKTLSCDDECARLLRNQKLARALDIDPETHTDDHIPYANDTLKMFRENVKWAQSQEREFRVFAADETEKRLRFKTMPAHQRAFLHALAEDFGFDSESMDPDPHRHVAVFKTPRFVMAPMKTLAECVRIRTSAEAASAAVAETQKKLRASDEPYNGFVLTHPRFGLTLEELRADCAPHLDSTPGLVYDISFLPNEEIVIKAKPASASTAISTSAIEASVKALKAPLSASVSSKRLAASVKLCALDPSLNTVRRESDDPALNGGWSQVAAKAAAPRSAPRQNAVGEKSVYTVLGSKLRVAKRKKEEMKKVEEVEVVDDWEEEMRKEEAAEKATEAHVGDSSSPDTVESEADLLKKQDKIEHPEEALRNELNDDVST